MMYNTLSFSFDSGQGLGWGNQHNNSVHCLFFVPHWDDMGILLWKPKTELNCHCVGCFDDILELVA